jgi:uroporphyrin-III C-methyltransferase
MSEEKGNKELDVKTQSNNAQKKKAMENIVKDKSTNKFSFIVSLVLIIIFSIAIGFINDRINNVEKELTQSSIKNSSAINNSDNQIKEAFSRFANVQKKLEELESKQDVLSRSLSQPEEQQVHVNKDYALAEIEHLLIIASYNLKLSNDVATALSAMEAADARLTGLTDPAALSVREQLIVDMNELQSMNQADLSGLGLYLSDLISRVDRLTLKENIVTQKQEINPEPKEEKVEGIKQFFILVFKELKSLVVITRDEDVSKARLLPDEIYFLRANLKLELANARFAVFNRDTNNLHASIGHLQTWLMHYFDMSDAAVNNIYNSLSSMKKLELAFPEVDISSSLESVRALIRYQDESNAETNEEGLNLIQ